MSLLFLGAASASGCDGCTCSTTPETCDPCTTGGGAGGSTGTECKPGEIDDCLAPDGQGGRGGQGGQGRYCGVRACTLQGVWSACYDAPVEIPGNDIDEDCDGEALPLTAALAPYDAAAMPSRFYLRIPPSEVWDPTTGLLSEADVPAEIPTADPAPFKLTRPQLSGSMFVEASDHLLGITWADPSADDRFEALIDGSRIDEALNGKGTLTLEAVVRTSAVAGTDSTIMYFGTAGPNFGEIDLRFNAPNELVFYWKGAEVARWTPTLFQRCTIHVVVDTAQPNVEDRVVLYRNGNIIPRSTSAGAVPALGDVVAFLPDSWFVIGNRKDGARAFPGTLSHFGVSGAALTAGEAYENHKLLRIAEGIQVVVE